MDSKYSSGDFKLTQVFGDKTSADKVSDEDIISSVKFDQTGKYLSLGDRAGRLIIFDVQQVKGKKYSEYSYYTEVRSSAKAAPIPHQGVRPSALHRNRGEDQRHQLDEAAGQEPVRDDHQQQDHQAVEAEPPPYEEGGQVRRQGARHAQAAGHRGRPGPDAHVQAI